MLQLVVLWLSSVFLMTCLWTLLGIPCHNYLEHNESVHRAVNHFHPYIKVEYEIQVRFYKGTSVVNH